MNNNQVLVQFRADKQLRNDCAAIYKALGMDLNTAFRMFMEKTIAVRGLPFAAVLPNREEFKEEGFKAFEALRAEALKQPELTLDEINEEIRLTREDQKKKERQIER